MGLRWQWDEKIGEATAVQTIGDKEQEYTLSLYEGNAELIMLHRWEQDGEKYWNMHSFWADKTHMKRMLGLLPKEGYSENTYETDSYRITKFRLSKSMRRFKEVTSAILSAFDNVTIETYTEE